MRLPSTFLRGILTVLHFNSWVSGGESLNDQNCKELENHSQEKELFGNDLPYEHVMYSTSPNSNVTIDTINCLINYFSEFNIHISPMNCSNEKTVISDINNLLSNILPTDEFTGYDINSTTSIFLNGGEYIIETINRNYHPKTVHLPLIGKRLIDKGTFFLLNQLKNIFTTMLSGFGTPQAYLISQSKWFYAYDNSVNKMVPYFINVSTVKNKDAMSNLKLLDEVELQLKLDPFSYPNRISSCMVYDDEGASSRRVMVIKWEDATTFLQKWNIWDISCPDAKYWAFK